MKYLLFFSCLFCLATAAQDAPRPERPPGAPGGGPGRGFGGGSREEKKLVTQFDKDGDKLLNATGRKAAADFREKEIADEPRRPGGPGRRGGEPREAARPGPKIALADVKSSGNASLYDIKTLRTFFLDFENADWSKEMTLFYNSDVEVPARLTVDGKTYDDVGVHYRGASSFFTVTEGWKRSMNIDVDFVNEDQNVGGYRTLNLLNSHRDPTYVRTVLYYQIAREYIPAPKANFARVVINGESWGPFVNAQQFNKEFIAENFGVTKGARWKVPGSPGAKAGLEYLGEDPAEYKKLYEIKTKDDRKSWTDFIKLCRVLNQTPPEKLEQELAPILNIEGVLKFLALENTLINSDGYWIRRSDYNIYQDEKGRFHIIPHDANETFGAPEGPGPRGGGGAGGGIELDPLQGEQEEGKPLLSKLLKAPGLKEKYLGYVRHIAENWLDWAKIGPIAEGYQALIAKEIEQDTRKLDSAAAFKEGLTQDAGGRASLKTFVEKRRAYLLGRPDVKNAKLPAKL